VISKYTDLDAEDAAMGREVEQLLSELAPELEGLDPSTNMKSGK
jgi:hypothetical protein